MKFTQKESQTLEFKESLSKLDDAGETLCGFANQRGGSLYFGIKDDGTILGIKSINEKTLRDLTQQYIDNFDPKFYFEISEENLEEKFKTIKITVEKSTTPFHTYKGIPYIRVGPSTRKMSQNEYQKRLIYEHSNKDYSSDIIPEAKIKDLSKDAIKELRILLSSSGRYKVNISKLTNEQLLKNLLLLRDHKLTIAALVLLGKEESISRFLPYSEIRYGYRIDENEPRNQDMEIFKSGYLTYYKQIWGKIDSKNINLAIPFKLKLIEKKAFDEETIREAINNAIVHRDYQVPASTIILQYPYKIILNSPGGFPEGVTTDNIINETRPRNKLIADILFKCQMVEQFGNGVNLMYKKQLSFGKLPPNFLHSDSQHVELELDGKIQDEEFAKYVLLIAEEKGKELNDKELIILNNIRLGHKVQTDLIVHSLLKLGLIEKIGRNRYILSKRYYVDIKQQWEYTQIKGLSINKNKELIIQHLENFGQGRKEDFINLFQDSITESQIDFLLKKLRKEGRIIFEGHRRSRSGYWKKT